MINASPISGQQPETSPPDPVTAGSSGPRVPEPEGWREIRGDADIQFDEFAMAPPEVREPGFLDEVWRSVGEFFAALFQPVGEFIGLNWSQLQWVLLGIVGLFALYWLARTIGPLSRKKSLGESGAQTAESDPQWQPSKEESLALLEDADRLASEGRFDEATHLLLKRSVSHIAVARPEWVDPSSTARELAALPELSSPARRAFSAISQRVERSLFALRSLDRGDWEAARAAYAEFAGSALDTQQSAAG